MEGRESPYSALDPTKKFIAKLIFRALCDYVHYKRWADGTRVPTNRKQREEKVAYEQAASWLFEEPLSSLEDDAEICVEDCSVGQEEARGILRIMDAFMTFESACDTMGWDASWIRERVPNLTKHDTDVASKKLGFM